MLIIKASTVIENPLLPHSPQGPQRGRRGRDELIRIKHSQSLPQALDIDPIQNPGQFLMGAKKTKQKQTSSHLRWREQALAGSLPRDGKPGTEGWGMPGPAIHTSTRADLLLLLLHLLLRLFFFFFFTFKSLCVAPLAHSINGETEALGGKLSRS